MTQNAEIDPALQSAINKAGSQRALADALKITPQALSQWNRVPVGRVLDVEKATGIPRHELRPDFYPVEPSEDARN